jgi:hypothetical protein
MRLGAPDAKVEVTCDHSFALLPDDRRAVALTVAALMASSVPEYVAGPRAKNAERKAKEADSVRVAVETRPWAAREPLLSLESRLPMRTISLIPRSGGL